MRILFLIFMLVVGALHGSAALTWQEEFSKMPLAPGVTNLNERNAIPVMLAAFQRNPAVKALLFLPGTTDEFYFFHRANASLTNSSPTLLDAVSALTNQTLIRATVRPPFLVLHTAEDPLEPILVVEDKATTDRLKQRRYLPHVLYDDRDWDSLQPVLSFRLNTKFLPGKHDRASNHFFRHSFAAYDLTGWETLEAICMTGKTRCAVKARKVVFEGDTRFLARPPTPKNFLMPRPTKENR